MDRTKLSNYENGTEPGDDDQLKAVHEWLKEKYGFGNKINKKEIKIRGLEEVLDILTVQVFGTGKKKPYLTINMQEYFAESLADYMYDIYNVPEEQIKKRYRKQLVERSDRNKWRYAAEGYFTENDVTGRLSKKELMAGGGMRIVENAKEANDGRKK